MEESLGAKEKILKTVVLLLKEKKDISRITNRQIASLANVNSALINYYFQSKENLINMAVGVCMGNVFEEIIEKAKKDIDPIERLKNMIKVISEVSYKNYDLIKITIASEMKDGGLTTNKLILPLLREIFGDSKTELQLKLISSQILIPLQTIFLNADAYKNYLKNDVFDNETRNEIIDTMIGNLLNIL